MRKLIERALAPLRCYKRAPRWIRFTLSLRRAIRLLLIVAIIASAVTAAALPRVSLASSVGSDVNVLDNGDFEHGFVSQPGCGVVGAGWHCFTNDGGANYGFYDEQWGPVVADGAHGQLIEINAKGVSTAQNDRYAGLYQTVAVVDWAQYTLSLKGMIRTTLMDGDPWRYTVQVGWTNGRHADWQSVTNWVDVGWYTYYPREAPGGFSYFSTPLMAEDDYVTIYVRAWKKWGIDGEEINISLDSIALIGPEAHHHGYGIGGPVAMEPKQPQYDYPPAPRYQPAPSYQPVAAPAYYGNAYVMNNCTYTVQRGDILGWIAQSYGMSEQALLRSNRIRNANLIYVGQVLQIPNCAVQPQPVAHSWAPQRVYTVQPGESLGYICQRFGVDVNTLAAINQLGDTNFIYVGQQLVIP
ncbi:MAG: LysM peptidoglycan-binding domain-containing protein [Caldilineaceae bacterium]